MTMTLDQLESHINNTRELRSRLLTDKHRPRYHFVAPEGTCMPFDPNGAIYWKGRYHLCYIFQDSTLPDQGHCWGHVSSADLLHWRHHKPALIPDTEGPERGIYSGNAFLNAAGEATIIYHGVDAGNCIATSSDDNLDNWNKMEYNPIVPKPKRGDPEFSLYSSWDPHGWMENGIYYAIFGGNPRDGTRATLFRSENMKDWQYLRPIPEWEMPDVQVDDDISCPDFFKLGEKYVLLCISHKRGCRYYLGDWINEHYYPKFHGWMNWPGGSLFAPESFLDNKGRRIFWAWVTDLRNLERTRAVGWSGTLSLPRELTLRDGVLHINPVAELHNLRMHHQRIEGREMTAGERITSAEIQGDCLELAIQVDPKKAESFIVTVCASPDGREKTDIEVNFRKHYIKIDLRHSTLDPDIRYSEFRRGGNTVTAQIAPFSRFIDELLNLQIYIDCSILEVFVNGRQCVTQRIYPILEESRGISLSCAGGNVKLIHCDAWEMAATNPY